MLLTILISALAAGPATVPNAVLRTPMGQSGGTAGKCLQTRVREAKDGPPLGASTLVDLPPGDLHLTVERTINGCQVPTIIRYGIGRR